jgi:hypothetical protein
MKWIKNRYLQLTFMAALSLLYSCEKESIKPIKVETASFSKDIQPIFSKCTDCHNGSRNPNLLVGKAYNSLKTGGYYNLTDPPQSIIYLQLTTNQSHISRASDLDKQKILLWIKLGAKND